MSAHEKNMGGGSVDFPGPSSKRQVNLPIPVGVLDYLNE